MAKQINNAAFDQWLQSIEDTYDTLTVCSAEPADPSGIAAIDLATHALTAADFTIADGDTSGRKTTLQAQNSVSVIDTGSATHVVLHDGVLAGSRQIVTTCSSVALTTGGTVNIGAWDIEFADPT